MRDLAFWQKQTEKALFPAVDTEAPEQKRFAGKLLVIGGNRSAFFAVAQALEFARKQGVGEVRAIVPRSLKKMLPATPEVFFAEAGTSGTFCREALTEKGIREQWEEWADAVLLAGDFSKNAEISLLLGDFLVRCEKPVYLMRDTVDAVTADAEKWLMREVPLTVFASVPQLQKIARAVYYPKMLSLSMPTNQLVELLHKFTLTYGVTVLTYHNGQIIVAEAGRVISTDLKQTCWTALSLWNGQLLVNGAVLKLWNGTCATVECLTTAMALNK